MRKSLGYFITAICVIALDATFLDEHREKRLSDITVTNTDRVDIELDDVVKKNGPVRN